MLAPIGPARATGAASGENGNVPNPTAVAICTPSAIWHSDQIDRVRGAVKAARPSDWCDKRERANHPGMTMSRVPRAKVC